MGNKNHENNVECFKRFTYPEAYELQGINGNVGSPLVDSMFGTGKEFRTYDVIQENDDYYLTMSISHFGEGWKGPQHEAAKKIARFGKLLNKRKFEETQWIFLQESVFGKSSFEMIEVNPGTHLSDCSLIFRMPTPKGLSFRASVGYLRFIMEIVNP